MLHRRPPRIAAFDYLGTYRYFVTCCTHNRQAHFVDAAVVNPLILQIRQTCSDRQFAVLAYVFMPDHLHLLLEGLQPEADFVRTMTLLRQRTAMSFRRQQGTQLWQDGYFERVLRDEEATETVTAYIVANPVRAGLVNRIDDYPFHYSWRPIEFRRSD